MNIEVIKRDKSLEDFSQAKIEKVALATGLSDAEAKKIANRVAKQVRALEKERVTSTKIRSFVLKELRKLDDYAAGLYEWYEKTKDNHQ